MCEGYLLERQNRGTTGNHQKTPLMLGKGGTKSAEKVLRPHLKMILMQHLFRQNDNESLMMYFHLECLCPNYMVLTYSLCQTNW